MKRLIFFTLAFFALMFAVSFTTPEQRKELIWDRVMADGTAGKFAGWDANGDPVEKDGAGSPSGTSNEIQKNGGAGSMDGTGLFSTTDGDLTMGTGLVGASRNITASGSATNVGLNVTSKGTGTIVQTSGTTIATLSAGEFKIGTSGVGDPYFRTQSSGGVITDYKPGGIVTNSAPFVVESSASFQINGAVSINPATNSPTTIRALNGSDITFTVAGGAASYFIVNGLPTSASGIPSGALWNDGGTIKIAP